MRLPAELTLRAVSGSAAYDGQGGMAMLGRIEGFAPGTAIATTEGDVPVEALAPGDLIVTPDGAAVPVLRCLTRRLDAVAQSRQPGLRAIRVAAGALGDGVPRRDLLLGPDQAVQVGGRRASLRVLVNGTTIRQDPPAGAEFVRLVLGVAGAVTAAGLPCPTRFAPPDPQAAVALRVMADRQAAAAPGRLTGKIEEAGPGHVVGWALDASQPEAPVPLEIALDGVAVAWAFASLRRPDLEMRGLGGGACAFAVRFAPLPATRMRWLTVRRASDGEDVPGSPILLAAASPPPEGGPAWLQRGIAAARTDRARNELAGILFAEIDRLTGMGAAP